MLVNQNELEKLCIYLYPKFFNYKDITLNDVSIKIDDYLHLSATLSYYNVETSVRAIARLRVDKQIIIDLDGVIKYGFINLNLNKVLKEMVKDCAYLTINDESIIIDNDYLKDISMQNGLIKIELK